MPSSLPNHDIDTACRNASAAFTALAHLAPDARAGILDAIAAALDTRRDEILTTCSEETALTIEELTPEFARTTGTLRMFAALVRDGSWVRAAIDTPYEPSAQAEVSASGSSSSPPSTRSKGSYPPIGPNHDLRSMLIPLGPVAVFGSSNFPLAYGVCGGDTASALAAGCPVIIKEHPAHPHTGRLLANIAQQAVAHTFDEPDAQARTASRSRSLMDLLQYLPNKDPKDFSVAQQLVHQPLIKAVGFTGSIPGGLAIEKLARERDTPTPVFAEMGSVNIVFITPGAIEQRAEAIADQLADSVFARFGQQCTKPGAIFFAPSPSSPRFTKRLFDRFRTGPTRVMLAPWIANAYRSRSDQIEDSGAASLEAFSEARVALDRSKGTRVVQSHLWGATLQDWNATPALRSEVFGPSTMWVVMESWAEAARVNLTGNLSLSIFSDETNPSDTTHAREIINSHARHAGRTILNGVPTGVRVATSMVHGGPFPATNAPHTTAVGPRAIERWCRPTCFQNCPDELLPPELQNANPRRLTRTMNGILSTH